MSSELVETTPLGLSAEQMSKSNPDAVKQLQTAAQQADRQRLVELQAAFPNDAGFALQSYTDGLSVEAAKAKRYDELAPKVSELEKKVGEMQQEIDSNKVTVTVSDVDSKPNAKASQQGGDLETEGLKLWESDANLRNNFGGEKTAFLADFKRHPDEYRKKS